MGTECKFFFLLTYIGHLVAAILGGAKKKISEGEVVDSKIRN
jgi:hypothetical protein